MSRQRDQAVVVFLHLREHFGFRFSACGATAPTYRAIFPHIFMTLRLFLPRNNERFA
jgi:hypothetical protein